MLWSGWPPTPCCSTLLPSLPLSDSLPTYRSQKSFVSSRKVPPMPKFLGFLLSALKQVLKDRFPPRRSVKCSISSHMGRVAPEPQAAQFCLTAVASQTKRDTLSQRNGIQTMKQGICPNSDAVHSPASAGSSAGYLRSHHVTHTFSFPGVGE